MSVLLLQISIQILLFQGVFGIVNLDQETANTIFSARLLTDLGPNATGSGIDCLNEVSKFYLVKREVLTRSYNMVLTVGKNMSSPSADIQDGFLKLMNEAAMANVTEKRYQLRILSDKLSLKNRTQFQEHNHLILADFYVIILDNVKRLRELLKICAESRSSWNPGARFLVLYNNVEERECESLRVRGRNMFKSLDPDESENLTQDQCARQSQNETIMEIFKQMLKNFYIHRIAILYSTDAFNYTLFSMDYFSKEACRTIIASKIGSCSRGKIYPNRYTVNLKMKIVQDHRNSENCKFVACATIAAPFVEPDCQRGLELRMLGFMRNRLKLNIEFQCSRDSRGVPDHQDKWTGLLGKLKVGDCDFIVGGYYPDNDVASAFWTSQCYLDDSHTWFIKLADERPAWMALYTIFDKTTWECFLLMTPITWIFWYFLVKFLPEPKNEKEFSLIGINNIGVSICVAVNERPLCYASRIFWFTLAIYGMNIASIYTSRLIAVFSDPGYLHQIDNIKEVIEAGIPFGGPVETADWFENDEDMWIFEHFKTTDSFIPNSQNLEAVKDGKRVILSSRLYVIQDNVSDMVFGFKENVFVSPVQIIMKPGFPFMFEINRLISYMNDAGIFNGLMNRFYFRDTYLKRIAKLRPNFKETNIVITTEHLEGPFLLLIMGTVCSIIICLIEIYLHRRANKPLKKVKTSRKRIKKIDSKSKSVKKRVKKFNENNAKYVSRKTYIHVRSIYDSNKHVDEVHHGIRFTPLFNRKIGNQN